MDFIKKIILASSVFIAVFFISGCAHFAKLVVGKDGIEIPQIVAHLEPSLLNNKIIVLGKIVIQNPTKSSLDLDKIYLEIRDENKAVLEKAVLDWERPNVTSKHELEAPVTIKLGLSALNSKNIAVFIRTGFTYKQFGLHIPIESKVAVIHLEALKEIITRPFYANIFTKLHSTIFGNSSVDFVVEITNPLSIDLAFDDGMVSVATSEGKDVAKTRFAHTVFKGSQSNQLKGSIGIGNIWGRLMRSESANKRPLKFQLSGHMNIPGTGIAIPFKIESVVAIKFSFS